MIMKLGVASVEVAGVTVGDSFSTASMLLDRQWESRLQCTSLTPSN